MRELKINPSFTGQVWETSKKEFSDSECPKMGEKEYTGSLQDCQAFCLGQSGCTAFNYKSSTTNCKLRGCKQPVVPPAKNKLPTYDGYWLVAKGS